MMKIRTEYIVAVIVVAAALAGAYLLISMTAKPQTVITQMTLESMVYSPDGSTIYGGYLVGTCLVDDRTEMVFYEKPENLSIPANDAQHIPAGSSVTLQNGVDMVLRPLGFPYISGPVVKKAIVYNDGTGTLRAWEYYALAYPEWDAVHAPYQATLANYNTGQLITSSNFCVGTESGWDTGKDEAYLGQGVYLTQLAGISDIAQPASDWAYYYDETGQAHMVLESALWNQYLGNVPGVRQTNLSVANMTYDTGTSERTYDSDGLGWKWTHGSLIGGYANATMRVANNSTDVVLSFTYNCGPTFTNINLNTKFNISTGPGWNPTTVTFGNINQNGPGMNYWFLNNGVRSTTGQIENGQFTLQFNTVQQNWAVSYTSTVELLFHGAVNTWKDFVEETQIQYMRNNDNVLPSFFGSPQMVPSGKTNFSSAVGANILYTQGVPTLADTGWGTNWGANSNPFQDTTFTAIRMLPGSGVYALVQLTAPISLYNAIIYRPPSGKPTILGKDSSGKVAGLTMNAWSTASWSISVRNDGLTGATFGASVQVPSGWTISGGNQMYIEVGLVGTFIFTVNVGQVSQTRTQTTRITVTAINDPAVGSPSVTDNATADFTSTPAGPINAYGDLQVTVLDDKTGAAISGASAWCGGISGTTDPTGVVLLKSIVANTQETLKVSAGGYEDYSTGLYILQGSNNFWTVRMVKLTPLGSLKKYLWLIITVVVVTIVVVSIAYYYHKRRRKT